MTTHIPRHLLLQWHLTDRCNLRCTHCYQDCYNSQELSFDEWLEILRQFRELLSDWRARPHGPRPTAHITVTGGEPFVHRDFLPLLEKFAQHRGEFTFAILTNGTLIDRALARQLRGLGPSFVQVSVEGSAATHERIRGPGSYERTITALRHLRAAGIRTLISFTAHRANYREFADVARLGRQLGVDRVWADRLIPHGTGAALHEQMLTPEETRSFMESMAWVRAEASQSWFNRTEIAMHRALQFLYSGGTPYHCTAGDSLITVLANGDVLPCRRMPIPVGNLRRLSLRQIYDESALFQELRDRHRLSEACQACAYSTACRGGLRCLSYAVTGDPFATDPGCWIASSRPTATSKLAAVPRPVASCG